jgi:hypothetical protein
MLRTARKDVDRENRQVRRLPIARRRVVEAAQGVDVRRRGIQAGLHRVQSNVSGAEIFPGLESF